jgi:hypothetical protein
LNTASQHGHADARASLIVHEAVDAAAALEDGAHHALDRARIGHVGRHEERVATASCQRPGGCPAQRALLLGHDHAPARGGEGLGRCSADARPAAVTTTTGASPRDLRLALRFAGLTAVRLVRRAIDAATFRLHAGRRVRLTFVSGAPPSGSRAQTDGARPTRTPGRACRRGWRA